MIKTTRWKQQYILSGSRRDMLDIVTGALDMDSYLVVLKNEKINTTK